ncbi:hypothetical protein G6011_03276 [Alternaria panax]|uniref:Uncharacterized protein n=1 Tax=Alternaria panax TaxID=48097 RepID=A0AAD4IEF3_9PLEO|nr:hypothetical protein G6011_03276 [Alternaria panax]
MRLLNLILPGVFAICAVAAPTDFDLHSPLAIRVPSSTTYDADVAAAIAYARTQPSSGTVKISATAPKKKLCGGYEPAYKSPPGFKDMHSNGLFCTETENGEEMERITNYHCGICMIFDKSQCQGNLIGYWGPATPPMELPGDKSHWAHGGKSYWCL